MSSKTLIAALGIAGFFGATNVSELPQNIHKWVLEMHREQVKLLKMDWGQPGFCTEWDLDYNPKTQTCGKRGKLIQRRYRK